MFLSLFIAHLHLFLQKDTTSSVLLAFIGEAVKSVVALLQCATRSAVSGCCFGCCYACISENTSTSDHRKCCKLSPKLILFHKNKCACKDKGVGKQKVFETKPALSSAPTVHLNDHYFVLTHVNLLLTLNVCGVPLTAPCFSCSCALHFLVCVPVLVFDKFLRFY